MAEPLKYMYNPAFFEKLCPVLRKFIPDFDCNDFIFNVFNNEWPDFELKQRVTHIAKTLHRYLPAFPAATTILINLSDEMRKTGVPEQGFAPIFIPEYIAMYGIDFPDESLAAIEEITKMVSAEFAIRPFLKKYTDKTIQKMLEWSKHPETNVRRLASEGCRPRLPWGMGIPLLKSNPSLILPILKNLKKDPSDYVQRSVANNLNDIAKDHPELVLSLARDWMNSHPATDRIIRHGCRTLLKKGNTNALLLHGVNPLSKGEIRDFLLKKKKINVGGELDFAFQFISKEKKPTTFRLEYAIDYVTSTNKVSTKIFRLKERVLDPKEILTVNKKQSFKDLTTRKHFKGKHVLSVIANGKKLGSVEFMVG